MAEPDGVVRFDDARLLGYVPRRPGSAGRDPIVLLHRRNHILAVNAARAGQAVFQRNFEVGATFGFAGSADAWSDSEGEELFLWKAYGNTLWLIVYGIGGEPVLKSEVFPLAEVRPTPMGGPGWEGYVRIHGVLVDPASGSRLVLGSMDGTLDGGPRGLFLLDPDRGRLRWWHDATNGGWAFLLDLDRDGRQEVWFTQDAPCNGYEVAGKRDSEARLEVLDALTGQPLPGAYFSAGERCFVDMNGRPTDTDGDGRDDRFVLCVMRRDGKDPAQDSVYVFSAPGRVALRRAFPSKVENVQFADVDWDGAKEMVVRYRWSSIEIFDANLRSVRKAPLAGVGTMHLITDLDGDDVPEIFLTKGNDILVLDTQLRPLGRIPIGRPFIQFAVLQRAEDGRPPIAVVAERSVVQLLRFPRVTIWARRVRALPWWPIASGGGLLFLLVLVGVVVDRRIRRILSRVPDPYLLTTASGRILGETGAMHRMRRGIEPAAREVAELCSEEDCRRRLQECLRSGRREWSCDLRLKDGRRYRLLGRRLRLLPWPYPARWLIGVTNPSVEETVEFHRWWAEGAVEVLHDIKNALQPLRNLARAPAAQDAAEKVTAAVDRIHALSVAFVAQYKRRLQEELLPVPTEVEPIVRETLEEFTEAWEGRIRSALHVSPDLQPVLADRKQLRVCLRELLQNATHAIAGEGRVEVRISRQRDVSESGEMRHWVRVEVQDDGRGMDEEELAACRKLFFSRRPGGTGLGLAMVGRTMEEMGGFLEISSEPGVGTVAALVLRVAE
jgi:signal transduction histidine kinase